MSQYSYKMSGSSGYVWGSDSCGQLGLGTKSERSYSYPVLCRWAVSIVEVSCGEEHTVLRTNEGKVYAMGSNAEGRLGVGDRNLLLSSSPVLLRDLETSRVVAVSSGVAHSAAITDSGQAYLWGVGYSGALGAGNTLSYWRPHLLPLSREVPVASISCGGHHTSIITRESSGFGQLHLCGSGETGQLGLGIRESQLTPIPLPFSESISEAVCGSVHTLFRTSTDRVFAMGGNSFGQLGIGSKRNSVDPVHVSSLDGVGVRKLAGWTMSAAVTQSGTVYVWGWGDHAAPYLVKTVRPVKDVCIGANFAILLDIQGSVSSWGTNSSGELGLGDFDSRSDPTPILALQAKSIHSISCGLSHIIALSNDELPSTPRQSIETNPGSTGIQGTNRLFAMYQSELEARKTLEMQLLNSHQSSSMSVQQIEALRAENLQFKEEIRRLRSELVQREADVTWQVQSNVSLAAKNKTFAEKIKNMQKIEIKAEELELNLEKEVKNSGNLAENVRFWKNKCEDLEYKLQKCEQDKSESKLIQTRLESDLFSLRKALKTAKEESEQVSKEHSEEVKVLNNRLEEVQRKWSRVVEVLEREIEEKDRTGEAQRREIEGLARRGNGLEEEVRELKGRGKQERLEREALEQKVKMMEVKLDKEREKNKRLVEALEVEVRARALALHRAQDTLAPSDTI